MSKVLGVHMALFDEFGILHQLAPGDDVPDWALDQVGPHCLAGDADPEAATEVDSDPEPTVSADVPDFTKKPVRRAGR